MRNGWKQNGKRMLVKKKKKKKKNEEKERNGNKAKEVNRRT